VGASGAQGPAGPIGPVGASGAPGANGTFDPAKLQYVNGPEVIAAPGDTVTAEAACPPGTVAVSGGFNSNITDVILSVTLPTLHRVAVVNHASIVAHVIATVVCAG
jgi:hypothetical protein